MTSFPGGPRTPGGGTMGSDLLWQSKCPQDKGRARTQGSDSAGEEGRDLIAGAGNRALNLCPRQRLPTLMTQGLLPLVTAPKP